MFIGAVALTVQQSSRMNVLPKAQIPLRGYIFTNNSPQVLNGMHFFAVGNITNSCSVCSASSAGMDSARESPKISILRTYCIFNTKVNTNLTIMIGGGSIGTFYFSLSSKTTV